ncbi:unnamed protein product [Eruca vesicaria subsp. sativa]|uniref:Uncharacterized protein n=1 Tax=Eruca vesicaria subsp. sativa TaxID=29727 RepID=A0ABC8JGK9_ERUVS|nr:unnamed protein product [Eruca vesicaria subsp. sativa]
MIPHPKPKNKITEKTTLKKIESENIPITTVIKVSKLKTELKKVEVEEGKRHEMYFTGRRLLPRRGLVVLWRLWRGSLIRFQGSGRMCIIKENNFKQPGDRYRSWAPDRQDRFVKRWVEILSEPRPQHLDLLLVSG